MTYCKDEVLSIVSDFLGEDAEGIYIPSCEYEWGASDLPAVSQFVDGQMWTIDELVGFDLWRGATKLVIVPVNADYVIKLNITGTYLTTDECEEAGLEYPCIDRRSTQDILDEEDALYEDLPKELKAFIKPNILIGHYRDMPVYVQEKIRSTYEMCSHFQEEQYKKEEFEFRAKVRTISTRTQPAHSRCSIFPEAFIGDMVKAYGEELTELILNQLNDTTITDLNYGNFGYDKNDKPCLFDIGGFDENEFFSQNIDYYNTNWDTEESE